MPVPQENLSFGERAEEPVLENGARCDLKQRCCTIRPKGFRGGVSCPPYKKFILKEAGKPVIENAARCELKHKISTNIMSGRATGIFVGEGSPTIPAHNLPSQNPPRPGYYG
jgi:hypothetical protein